MSFNKQKFTRIHKSLTLRPSQNPSSEDCWWNFRRREPNSNTFSSLHGEEGQSESDENARSRLLEFELPISC